MQKEHFKSCLWFKHLKFCGSICKTDGFLTGFLDKPEVNPSPIPRTTIDLWLFHYEILSTSHSFLQLEKISKIDGDIKSLRHEDMQIPYFQKWNCVCNTRVFSINSVGLCKYRDDPFKNGIAMTSDKQVLIERKNRKSSWWRGWAQK